MQKDIKQIVKEKYAAVVENEANCCAPSCCGPKTEDYSTFNESYDHLDGYTKDADYNLGCGIPTEFVDIKEGDTVLDLGSGAGNDVFVARSMVGEQGHVLGLDFTEAMIEKANQNKAKLGFDNVTFVYGDIEEMPIQSDTVDIIISNCVMNLVPNKQKAFSEVHRVLKPGGTFSISDIVTNGELTPEVRNAAALYAGCVSGALLKEEYLDVIRSAGFKTLEVKKERLIHIGDDLLKPYLSEEEIVAFRKSDASVYSVTVVGTKS